MTKKDLDDLEKPDTMVHRGILSKEGNPSKVFMLLELKRIPVRFVIMKSRQNLLRYTLNESIESMILQVYEALKVDSRRGDFVNLVQKDMETLEIELSEEDISSCTQSQWENMFMNKLELMP